MSKVAWDVLGERLYHAGVDRGMLYTDEAAVPWNGLTKITENPTGADPAPYYLDGRKILNVAAGEDFGATVEAFSAPDEFAPCAGRIRLSTGLFAMDQPKETFGFSYRTMVGNDTEGSGFGYKIHIVYNATAQIADFVHSTMAATPSVNAYSWSITTVPVSAAGYKPSSHVVFDTRSFGMSTIAAIEAILYGDDDNDPRLPTIAELFGFQSPTWWNLSGLSDFPSDAKTGDLGVDFITDNIYSDDVEVSSGFWWDLTGLSDFPSDALLGDWGVDTSTGEVWQKILMVWWDLTGLSDFPTEASSGDLGVDFSTYILYAEDTSDPSDFWWDLSGLTDFPSDASVGDWGIDLGTGEVSKKTG